MRILSIALPLCLTVIGFALPAQSQPKTGNFRVNQPEPQLIAQSKSRSFIGLRYRNLPKSLTDLGGWVVSDGTVARFAVSHVRQGSQQMLWFEKLIDYDNNGRPMFQVIDVLNLPTFSKTEQLTTGSRGCMQNGQHDRELAVLVEATNTEKWTQISKAWRANRRTGKFEKVSTKGIVCENTAWGV